LLLLGVVNNLCLFYIAKLTIILLISKQKYNYFCFFAEKSVFLTFYFTFSDFQVFSGTFTEHAKSRLSSRMGGLHSKIINLKNNYYEYMLHK